jgi:hypothetical protein
MIASKKTVKNNDIGKHCDMLFDAFFNFTDGNVSEVRLIDIRDISEPMPPQVDQIKKMLARCDKAWKEYCDLVGLSGHSRNLLINRVEKEWLKREKMMMRLQKRKRTQSATN